MAAVDAARETVLARAVDALSRKKVNPGPNLEGMLLTRWNSSKHMGLWVESGNLAFGWTGKIVTLLNFLRQWLGCFLNCAFNKITMENETRENVQRKAWLDGFDWNWPLVRRAMERVPSFGAGLVM